MSHDEKPLKAKAPLTESQATAQDISFGVQQTLACWSTDAIDPPLSKFIQESIGNKAHDVTNKHVWYGEVVGDSVALFEFVALKKLFRAPIESITQGVKSLFNKRLDKMGKHQLEHWAAEHHVSTQDPRYQQKLEEYKNFQAHNLVDSSIIATSATLSNVSVQRLTGNKQSYPVILLSKVAGALITMGIMMGARTAVPNSMKRLDDELSERYFSKVAHWLQKAAGVAPAANTQEELQEHAKPHTHGLAANMAGNAAIGTLGGALGHFAMDLEPVQARLGEHPATGIAAGAGAAIAAAHMLVPDSVQAFKHELDERYFSKGKHAHKHAEEGWQSRVDSEMPESVAGRTS